MQLKVGIVGAGGIAKSFHLPAWQQIENTRVVAICDIRESAAKELAKSQSKTYSSLAEMIANEELDIVDICTPNALHAEHILMALNHGIHAIVEKPFVTQSQDVDQIIKVANEKKLKVMCAQHQRFRPSTKVVRDIIEAGELGDIYYAKAQAIELRRVPTQNGSFTNKALSGGGPLMDLGAHILDVTWWLMGCPKPISVFGHVYKKLADHPNISNANGSWDIYNVEDFVSGQIKFESGAVITIEVSYLLNARKRAFSSELMGTEGGVLWPDMILTTEQNGCLKHSELEVFDQSLASFSEIQHFVDCVQNNENPIIPLEESKKVIQMIEALYQSSEQGIMINFD